MKQTKKYSNVNEELRDIERRAKLAKTQTERNRLMRRLKEILKEQNLLQKPLTRQELAEGNGKVAEITERKCSPNIQPRIKVGKRYFIDSRDKMKDGTRVLILVDWSKSQNGKVKTMRCNEKRFSWRIISDEEIREEELRKKSRETTNQLLHSFTFEEHMQIAFVPLVIIHCAWFYADRVLQQAAAQRIEVTKKLGRAVKKLKEEYEQEQAKDLDLKHRRQIEEQGDKFLQTFARDFVTMQFTLRNELLKVYPDDPYIDMRADAFIAMLLCDYCKKQQEECDQLIAQRTGQPKTPTILNPKIDALRTCMDAYTGTVEIDLKGNVELCVRILSNNLKKINFTLEHEQRINGGKGDAE